jgi:putative membrane protein
MSILHRTRNAPAAPEAAADPRPSPANPPSTLAKVVTNPPTTSRVPRTRIGAAWFGICAAALAFVALIIFMLQNTRSVEVTFLWMHGTLPLALALLIAGVGVTILAMVVGTARITQLRRMFAARPIGPRGPHNNNPTP